METLRTALEAGITAQLLVFVAFLATGEGRRQATGFFLLAIAGSLALAILLNALAGAGILPGLRLLNFFIDLLAGPLLLGFAARAGERGPPLRSGDLVHLWVVPAGLLALATRTGTDALVIGTQAF